MHDDSVCMNDPRFLDAAVMFKARYFKDSPSPPVQQRTFLSLRLIYPWKLYHMSHSSHKEHPDSRHPRPCERVPIRTVPFKFLRLSWYTI